MSKIFKTEAVVIQKRNLLGKDIILALFTEKYGKIAVFAKGAKKITSRRLPHIQIGNLIKAVIYQKNDQFYLRETKLISAFLKIKENQRKLSFLYFYFFILNRFLPEQQKEKKIYQSAIRFLIDLSNKEIYKTSDLNLEINQLMKFFGYLYEEKNFNKLKIFIKGIINEELPDFGI